MIQLHTIITGSDFEKLAIFVEQKSREERDPLILAKMLAVGRQCLLDTQYKFDMAEVCIFIGVPQYFLSWCVT